MGDSQIDQLRRHLTTVHDRFEALYRPRAGEPYAMEIEFKITSDNILAVKQARPWVFSGASSPPPPPRPPSPPSRPAPVPTPPPATAPGAPAIQAVTPGRGYLTVTWNAPQDDGGAAITAYDLRHALATSGEAPDAEWTLANGAWNTPSPGWKTAPGMTCRSGRSIKWGRAHGLPP